MNVAAWAALLIGVAGVVAALAAIPPTPVRIGLGGLATVCMVTAIVIGLIARPDNGNSGSDRHRLQPG
jgi:hypothetical protein